MPLPNDAATRQSTRPQPTQWDKQQYTGDAKPLRDGAARFLYDDKGPFLVLIFDLVLQPAVSARRRAVAKTVSKPEIYIVRSCGHDEATFHCLSGRSCAAASSLFKITEKDDAPEDSLNEFANPSAASRYPDEGKAAENDTRNVRDFVPALPSDSVVG
jgi:hypothetical protein